jgi:hypothetical protein
MTHATEKSVPAKSVPEQLVPEKPARVGRAAAKAPRLRLVTAALQEWLDLFMERNLRLPEGERLQPPEEPLTVQQVLDALNTTLEPDEDFTLDNLPQLPDELFRDLVEPIRETEPGDGGATSGDNKEEELRKALGLH